jgi:hypothetical protein
VQQNFFIIVYKSFLLQMNCYYGLMSTKPIDAPVLTTEMISLPFNPGCLYVAYPAEGTLPAMSQFSCYLVHTYTVPKVKFKVKH